MALADDVPMEPILDDGVDFEQLFEQWIQPGFQIPDEYQYELEEQLQPDPVPAFPVVEADPQPADGPMYQLPADQIRDIPDAVQIPSDLADRERRQRDSSYVEAWLADLPETFSPLPEHVGGSGTEHVPDPCPLCGGTPPSTLECPCMLVGSSTVPAIAQCSASASLPVPAAASASVPVPASASAAIPAPASETDPVDHQFWFTPRVAPCPCTVCGQSGHLWIACPTLYPAPTTPPATLLPPGPPPDLACPECGASRAICGH